MPHADSGTVSARLEHTSDGELLERRPNSRDRLRVSRGLSAKGHRIDRSTKGTVEGTVEHLHEVATVQSIAEGSYAIRSLTGHQSIYDCLPFGRGSSQSGDVDNVGAAHPEIVRVSELFRRLQFANGHCHASIVYSSRPSARVGRVCHANALFRRNDVGTHRRCTHSPS